MASPTKTFAVATSPAFHAAGQSLHSGAFARSAPYDNDYTLQLTSEALVGSLEVNALVERSSVPPRLTHSCARDRWAVRARVACHS